MRRLIFIICLLFLLYIIPSCHSFNYYSNPINVYQNDTQFVSCGGNCTLPSDCKSSCPMCIHGKCTKRSVSDAMVITSSVALLCVFLVIGKFLRVILPPLQWLYLPASVIGGFVGLAFVQLSRVNDTFHQYVMFEWVAGWNELPGFLISIVFAGLFLGKKLPPAKQILIRGGPQFIYGQIIGWGQYAVGLAVTACLLSPVFGVHPLFGTSLPIGFEGGHGTAAGLANSYAALGWKDGGDVGLAMATIGIFCGIVFGMIFVPIARRLNWVSTSDESDSGAKAFTSGLYPADEERPIAGVQTVSPDSIDVLSFHMAILGIALLFGYGIKRFLIWIESLSATLTAYKIFSGFPMFSICMLGGMFIQLLLQLVKMGHLIDFQVTQRLIGLCLDFLIVAAVSMINITAIGGYVFPIIIIATFGLLWQLFMLLVGARLIFNDHWFERGICEFGKSCGVTATGLLLLRIVDPKYKTPVTEDFSLKLIVHEPLFAGLWMGSSLSILTAIPGGIWSGLGICLFCLLFFLGSGILYKILSRRFNLYGEIGNTRINDINEEVIGDGERQLLNGKKM